MKATPNGVVKGSGANIKARPRCLRSLMLLLVPIMAAHKNTAPPVSIPRVMVTGGISDPGISPDVLIKV